MDEWDRGLIKYQQLIEDMEWDKDEMLKSWTDMYNRMHIPDDTVELNFEEFAVTLMDELTENGLDSHILLKYPKIADWWGSVLKDRKKKAEAQRKREEARRKKEEDQRARDAVLARLTPEEKRLLGVK
jgi:hypothetical protein